MSPKKRKDPQVEMDVDPGDSGNPEGGGEGPDQGLSLEERLQRLDRIVAELEGGEVELERGLELFEEGVTHIRAAESLLSRAELRVEELVGEAEALEERPLEEGENG
jgi:exodeoxyribonuclease VII small subunit